METVPERGSRSSTASRPAQRAGLVVTWLGHSSVAIELDGVRILTDPVFRVRVAHLLRVDGTEVQPPAPVDAVLVSHAHHDHLDLPSLRRIGLDTRVVVPRGTGQLLRRNGFWDVVELDADEAIRVGRVTVRATPALHQVRRGVGVASAAIGYVLAGSGRVYFAGDTDLFDAMRGIAPALDVALLPVAGWGPRTPAGHLDPRRAAEALGMLGPRVAVPIHWGTYRRIGLRGSSEDLRAPAERFAQLAARTSPQTEVRILAPGESTEIADARRVPR